MEEYLLTLLASITVAALFVALVKVAKDKRLKQLFLLIALVFIFFLLLKVAIISPENNRLNYTVEDSRYWNCTLPIDTCEGQPEIDSCNAYTVTQCNEIDADGGNCTWNQGLCEGTLDWTCEEIHAWGLENGYGHDKCDETYGCLHALIFESSLCDEINVTYYYDYEPSFADEVDTLELTEILTMFMVCLLVLMFFLVDALNFFRKWIATLQFKHQKTGPPT